MPPPAAVRLPAGRRATTSTRACAIWRAGIDDYQGRLNQPAMPDDLAPLRRLLAHLLATDPDRFWVAERGDGTAAAVGRVRAARRVREGLWFLAMLFVDPATAGATGSGRR